MRVAILVAVVAAHIVLLWLFPSLRRLVLQAGEDDMSVVPIVMPPLPSDLAVEPVPEAEAPTAWEAPLLYHSALAAEASRQPPGRKDEPRTPTRSEATRLPPEAAAAQRGKSALQDNTGATDNTPDADSTANTALSSQQPLFTAAPPTAPDWRAQAQVTAQSNAQHIVEAEDLAAHQAAALTSGFRPLPGPRVPGPKFGWDETPAYRVTPVGNGAFMIPLTDHCAIMILIVPLIGCSIGHNPPANGDLFKYMHGPVKFGDWDWRVADP